MNKEGILSSDACVITRSYSVRIYTRRVFHACFVYLVCIARLR